MPNEKTAVYFPVFGHASGRKPHYRPIESYSIPQGPIFLATAVNRLGHEAAAVDGNFVADPVGSLLACRPGKILISSTTAAWRNAMDTVDGLRARGFRGEIFVGGSHASLNRGARDWLLPQRGGVRYVSTLHESSLFGWIPEVFPGRSEREALGPCAENEQAHADRRSNLRRGRLFPEFVPDYEWMARIYSPDADWHAVHASGAKVRLGPSLITALGCTEACTFCANPFMYELSFLSPWALEEAVARLKRLGVKKLGITDMYYWMNPKHARSVGRLLKREGIPFSIQTCLESLTESVLDELASHGCQSMLVGIENPDSHTLTKHVDLDDVGWLLEEATGQRRIRVKLSYIVGLPGVDFVSDIRLIKHIEDRVPGRGESTDIQCNIYTPYRPDPDRRYAPYSDGAEEEPGLEYILDRAPFHYWGTFPISLRRPQDFVERMMLCDVVSSKIFPRWRPVYLDLRADFCAALRQAYPRLHSQTPSPEESLEVYQRIAGRTLPPAPPTAREAGMAGT